MPDNPPQNLQNHGRTDPWFLALLIIVILNGVFAIVSLSRGPHGFRAAWETLFSAALIILVLRVRQYPLKVQDRLIRLEERLRLQALAPPEWHPQILRLTESQLVGLRFAGDDEVVALAQQALAENLNRKQIKERIRSRNASATGAPTIFASEIATTQPASPQQSTRCQLLANRQSPNVSG